ncbi:MAG: Fic family protein, partial [Rhodospirillaceae bacterium]|nr:Fic family protein [Rhodospirillaceae bacterium]
PADPELISDPTAQAEQEAANALRQYDEGVETIKAFLDNERPFKLRLSLILSLHRVALEGLSSFAGNFRPSSVEIEQSNHTPPDAHLVPELMEEMCDYINENWDQKTAIHLAAYAMWRLNWIHPFADGNGRTSRIISYVVLCLSLGETLPGNHTIPEQITENRQPYFDALDAADAAYAAGEIDLSKMENLLENMLGAQLYSLVREAGGGTDGVEDD